MSLGGITPLLLNPQTEQRSDKEMMETDQLSADALYIPGFEKFFSVLFSPNPRYQNSADLGALGYGMTSRIFAIPVTN
jgi:hypothetical protein